MLTSATLNYHYLYIYTTNVNETGKDYPEKGSLWLKALGKCGIEIMEKGSDVRIRIGDILRAEFCDQESTM